MDKLPKNALARLAAATAKTAPKAPAVRARNTSEKLVTQGAKAPLAKAGTSTSNIAAAMSKRYAGGVSGNRFENKSALNAKNLPSARQSILSQASGLKVKSPAELAQSNSANPKPLSPAPPKSILKKTSTLDMHFRPTGSVKKIRFQVEERSEIQEEPKKETKLLSPDVIKLQKALAEYKEELNSINEFIYHNNNLDEDTCEELIKKLDQIKKSIIRLGCSFGDDLKDKEVIDSFNSLISNTHKMKRRLTFHREIVLLSNSVKKTFSAVIRAGISRNMRDLGEVREELENQVMDFNAYMDNEESFSKLRTIDKMTVAKLSTSLKLSLEMALGKHEKILNSKKKEYIEMSKQNPVYNKWAFNLLQTEIKELTTGKMDLMVLLEMLKIVKIDKENSRNE